MKHDPRGLVCALAVVALLPGCLARTAFEPVSGAAGDDAVVSTPWSTFLGGPGTDYGGAIAVDLDGNAYVGGMSNTGWGTPVRGFSEGNWDALVAKLDPDGDLEWHTFLGGLDWGGDQCQHLAIDDRGHVLVTGYSGREWGDPVRPFSGGGADALIAELDREGNLVWHTFLGGTGEDAGHAITLDAGGNLYVVGQSDAAWIAPATVDAFAGGLDAFVAKLRPDGSLVWNTFLGSGQDDHAGNEISTGGGSRIHVLGSSSETWGAPVRAFSGSSDAFVAELDMDGTLVWNTFLGAAGDDEGRSLVVDAAGQVIAVGYSTATWDTPLRAFSGDAEEAYAARLSRIGEVVWTTFLGGDGVDIADSIAVDSQGQLAVSGFSRAPWGTPLRAYAGGLSDAFVAGLTGDGVLRWSTFLGSPGGPGPDDDYGNSVAIDRLGNVYVAGDSDATWGLPRRGFTTETHDVFAARLDDSGSL